MDGVTNFFKPTLISTGGEVDEDALTALLAELEGKDVHALLAKGDADLEACVGVGGGGGGGAPACKLVLFSS